MNTPSCPRCQQSDRLAVLPGAGPHHSKLHCQRCSCWVKWLSKQQFEQMKGQLPIIEQMNLLGGDSW